jgi:hypothetical protein
METQCPVCAFNVPLREQVSFGSLISCPTCFTVHVVMLDYTKLTNAMYLRQLFFNEHSNTVAFGR